MELLDFTDEELEVRDIPEVKESRISRIRNWLSFRKNRNVVEYNDIPAVRLSRSEKADIRKANRELKRETKLIRKQDKKTIKKENRELRKQNRLEKRALRKQRRLEKRAVRKANFDNKKDMIKSYAKVAVYSILTSACFAGVVISAVSLLTIGFGTALLTSTALGLACTIFNTLRKSESEKLSNLTKASNGNQEVKSNSFFKSLKQGLGKQKEKEENVTDNTVELAKEETEEKTINVKNLVVADDVSNVKLTREDKIARVKAETKLARVRVNNVTSYCIFVAKDDIKLQKFIRSEYRKENPEEKIQSFDMGDTKVLVLANRPNFK